jgi:hypothetical protein
VSKYGRVGLVGPSGCGKSGVIRYALSKDDVAMILINVVTEDRSAIATVRGFLEILVSQLVSRASKAGKLNKAAAGKILQAAQPTMPLDRREIKQRAELGGSYWLLRAGIAREVTKTIGGGQAYTSTDDLRDAAREALAVVAGYGMVPVLVADDTDRLLNVAANKEEGDRLVRGFFGEVLREISEQLDCGLVVAVHDEYRERADYQKRAHGLITHLRVPKLTKRSDVAAIVTQRASFLNPPASCEDLVGDDALAALLRLHRRDHEGSVRNTLAVLSAALVTAASEDGAEVVTERHVLGAAAG